ncbi:hypothetical protein [Pseudomonas sp. SDO55104_S430]
MTQRTDIIRLADQHQKLAAFLTAALIFMILHKIKGVAEFPWDAGGYWKLSAANLLFDFPKGIRGYFYPALLAPARFVSDSIPVLGLLPYRIISSLAYAYFFAILVPAFYVQVFGGQISFLRRLITPLLVAILFPGVIIFSLSDLPALALMIGASACVLSSVDATTRLKRYMLLLLAGLLAYGAYNTRTIFLFPAGALALATGLIVYYKHDARTRVYASLAFFLGAAIASIPQIVINHKNQNSYSPMVITTSPYNRSLFASQLLWGITLQRYETSVDKTSPGAGVFYLDKAGERLFADNNIGKERFGLSAYLKLALQHPIDFIAIYGRHVVNGLDLRDGEVYTTGQPWRRNGLALVNFLILFAGFLVITLAISQQRAAKQQKINATFWTLLTLLPVIAIVPGAIETRFFLALHVSIYCALAFTTDFSSLKDTISKNWLWVGLALLISATLFFSVSTITMSGPQYDYSDLYRGMW